VESLEMSMPGNETSLTGFVISRIDKGPNRPRNSRGFTRQHVVSGDAVSIGKMPPMDLPLTKGLSATFMRSVLGTMDRSD